MSHRITTELQQVITAEQAYHYKVIPIGEDKQSLTFKSSNASSSIIKRELNILLGKEIILQGAEEDWINEALKVNYHRVRLSLSAELSYSEDFLRRVIEEAHNLGSSDIHFEAFEHRYRIRFRIDGKLIERYVVAETDYIKQVNRLKIMAGSDISEKRLPQDGSIHTTVQDKEIDIRASFLPTLYGEKVVLRLLSKDALSLSLDALGMNSTELKNFRRGIQQPHGLILICGPTGSGKTTTLYASLKELNTEDNNILTIEDPIEYTLDGISQVQLQENIGLDFTKALKTFLRQDPDIIMVGEIRDTQTAQMALRASLTGHLVLSTIHTNSAWGAITRLIDMGVPSFLITSTLQVSAAQRLVRLLCDSCKVQQEYTQQGDPYELSQDINIHYTERGCEQCNFTGFNGRIAVYEILPITDELAVFIREGVRSIEEYHKRNNIRTLRDNALELVKQGSTSIKEVYSLIS